MRIPGIPDDEARVIVLLGQVAEHARNSASMDSSRYVRCVISHLLGFAATSSEPHQAVEEIVDWIRRSAASPRFKEAIDYEGPKS